MLKFIFWIIVGVLALSFFGISLETVVNSPAGQANFSYLWQIVLDLWHWLTGLLQH